MSSVREIALEPAAIEEWDAEDLVAGRLAAELQPADPDTARKMLEHVRLELPDVLDHRDLIGYCTAHATPLAESLAPDVERFDFHLVEVPLGILIPENAEDGRRLVRLRLGVGIEAEGTEPCIAYDLFPRDEWSDVEHTVGEVSIDIAKALTFVFPAAGDVLGLKLTAPLRWRSRDVRVRTSDRMSNPVEWYVTDRSITEGFTGYLIARVPKHAPVTLRVSVVCELRRRGILGRVMKATYRSGKEVYRLDPAVP